MTFDERLRAHVKDMVDGTCNHCQDTVGGNWDECECEEMIRQDVAHIKKLIADSWPEKKKEPKSDIWLDWSETDFINYGYNLCRKDIKERLK